MLFYKTNDFINLKYFEIYVGYTLFNTGNTEYTSDLPIEGKDEEIKKKIDIKN